MEKQVRRKRNLFQGRSKAGNLDSELLRTCRREFPPFDLYKMNKFQSKETEYWNRTRKKEEDEERSGNTVHGCEKWEPDREFQRRERKREIEEEEEDHWEREARVVEITLSGEGRVLIGFKFELNDFEPFDLDKMFWSVHGLLYYPRSSLKTLSLFFKTTSFL